MIRAINSAGGHVIKHHHQTMLDHGIRHVRSGQSRAGDPAVSSLELFKSHKGSPMGLVKVIGGDQGKRPDGSILTPDGMTGLVKQDCSDAFGISFQVWDAEIINEWDMDRSAEEYAKLIDAGYRQLRSSGYQFEGQIHVGGLAETFDSKALDYIGAMIATGLIPEDVIFTPHWYWIGSDPMKPRNGFSTPEGWWEKLIEIIKPRRFGCGELGAVVGVDDGGGVTLTSQQQADRIVQAFGILEKLGAYMGTVYQLYSGASQEPIDNYGLMDNAFNWRPGSERVFAGAGPVVPPGPTVPDPPTPPPVRPPSPPLKPGSMKVGLRYQGGAIGIDPGKPETVYADRQKVAEWEWIELTPMGGGLFSARLLAANRQLSIQPGGQLESRPAGDVGSYETFYATQQPEQAKGAGLLYRVVEPGNVPVVLTIEAVA